MRKIDLKTTWLAQQGPLIACPTCGEPMVVQTAAHSLSCANGHQRDFNRKGTVNFLTKPVKTDYQLDMLSARRRMLSAGLFDPFLNAIAAGLTSGDRFLDVGCGEGSPTQRIQAQSGASAFGFDISKDAITLAGQLETPSFFAVADLAHLPFLDETFSAIVDIFSPGNYPEFERVLASGGQILKIVPEADYLRELRQGLYEGTSKASYTNDQVKQRFLQAFPHAQSRSIAYDFPLTSNQFQDLMAMTPLSWQAPASKRAQMLADPPVSIHIAVSLLLVKKL